MVILSCLVTNFPTDSFPPSSSHLFRRQLLQVSVQPERRVFEGRVRSVPGNDRREDLSADTTSLYQTASFSTSQFPGCQKTPGAFGGGHDTDVEERHKETLNSLWLEPQKTRDDWKTVSAEFAFCGVTRETLFFERTTFFKWSSMGFFKRWCPWLGSESDSLCPLTWSNVIQARGGCTCTSFTLCTCNYLLVLDIVFLAVRAPDENYVTTYYID